jgi:replicative DNA helicase
MTTPTREPFDTPPSAIATPRLVRPADLLEEWEADATAAHQARVTGQPRGPVTGLEALDQELGGYLPPGLHVVHGGPGIGKTAFALQVATSCGCPALYLTCEMGPLELLRRITARLTGTFLGRLKSGEYAPAESLAKARQAIAAVPDLVIADATQAFAKPDWLRDVALSVKREQVRLLIVVDSVHSWADGAPDDLGEYERLNSAVGALRALAGALDCPILAIAERNRASMQRGGLNAVAGSRKFEYTGETVLDLSEDDKAPLGAPGTVALIAKLQKNRHGAPGKPILLRFNGALQQFEVV